MYLFRKKYFVVIKLAPAVTRLEPSKLPHSIYLSIPDSGFAVSMPFESHFRQRIVCILLVSYTHLVITRNFIVTKLDPFGGAADKVYWRRW